MQYKKLVFFIQDITSRTSISTSLKTSVKASVVTSIVGTCHTTSLSRAYDYRLAIKYESQSKSELFSSAIPTRT